MTLIFFSSSSVISERSLGTPIARDVTSHKRTNDLSGRLILRTANFQEFFSKAALNPDAQPNVLPRHVRSVAIGYTSA
jgi:hypothetical protein